MGAKRQKSKVREAIAQEAARIMSQQMVRDYQQAKLKACERLGYSAKNGLPGNEEIQAALQSYLQVFKADAQEGILKKLRAAAEEAMRFLREFEPRLVGSVLNGTADEYSAVHLHVFAETEEKVLQFLMDKGIPYELDNKLITYRNGRQQQISVCRFTAGDTIIELSLFDTLALREAPKSPVDGKPMRRATLSELQLMLESV